MRITDIDIDRFGVWRDLTLPLNANGVTVFYGPNEAGKSTLMRFIRGTLYGFPPQRERLASNVDGSDGRGALRITHEGCNHVVRRETDGGQAGRVRVDELDWGSVSENRVRAFLCETGESVFENIFAIGLQELQELATLDGEEVARHIYGLSLGLDGERILSARDGFARDRSSLISDDHKTGTLVELALRIEQIDRELADAGAISQKHQHLAGQRKRLADEIEQAERRRGDIEDNLRGYRHLERIHGPWSRERKLRQEHSALPRQGSFPADGLARYDAISREVDGHKRQRLKRLQDAKQLYREADAHAGDAVLRQHECTIRRLVEERDDIKQRQRRLGAKQSRADTLKRELEAKIAVGGRAAADGIRETSTPAAALVRLLQAGRAYQQALAKKARAVGRYRRLVSGSQKRQADFNERLKTLGGTSLDSAVKVTRRRLSEIEELNRLQLEEARLCGQGGPPVRAQSLAGNPKALLKFRDLPPLFYLIMWFFTMAGLTLFVLGLWGAATQRVAAGNTAWIVGGIYSCFGLCMAGVTWTVRQHFEQFFEGGLAGDATFSLTGTIEEPPQHDPDADRKLLGVRRSIADLLQRRGVPGLKQSSAEGRESIPSDVLVRLATRLAELEGLRRDEERIQEDRQRLSRSRELLRQRQRDVGGRRREWCDVVRQVGLDETLKFDKAIEQWQILTEARELHREHGWLLELVERDRNAIESHGQNLNRLMGLLPAGNAVGNTADPDRLLRHWLEELRNADGTTPEQSRLRREARDQRKQASRLALNIRKLASQRRMLLVQAGVSTRDELEAHSRLLTRSVELARLLEDAQLEVQLVAEEEPELAIVEEDLLAYSADLNKRRIADSEIELKQIDRDIQTAREELGRVKRELTELANDRRAVSLRFEREQAARELRTQTERWCALELAAQSIDGIRQRLERNCQSETLQLASRYLAQLTAGKYHNVWAPLGERHLCIDDDGQQTLRAEQLSTGTREQLFLAIRLAMIRRFALEGTELPMVLDDVFVNFDQTRTEAAVRTILDVAQAGQQVLLFTCHLHLADIFEEQGVDAVWLPSHQPVLQERRAG